MWREFLRANPSSAIWFTYHDAPEELRALSTCGGDEDQIVVHLTEHGPSSAYRFGSLSCCSNDEFKFEEFTVWIGCHA